MKPGWLPIVLVVVGALVASGAVVIASVALADFPMGNAAFARTLFDVVGRNLPDLSVRGRILVVAQAALESGWGTLSNGRSITNNLFNVTAGASWSGPTQQGDDTDAAGNPITQTWRSYPSVDAAVLDWWDLLARLYPDALAELQGDADPAAFAHALVSGPRRYFSLKESTYAARLSAVAQQVASYLEVSA